MSFPIVAGSTYGAILPFASCTGGVFAFISTMVRLLFHYSFLHSRLIFEDGWSWGVSIDDGAPVAGFT